MQMYDTVVQEVDWGDYTRTVDPLKHEKWVYDSYHGNHLQTLKRGREIEQSAMMRMKALLPNQPSSKVTLYTPSATQLMYSDGQFESCEDGVSQSHGVPTPFKCKVRSIARDGQRPIIDKLHREGRLGDVDNGTIERRVYAEVQRQQARLQEK